MATQLNDQNNTMPTKAEQARASKTLLITMAVVFIIIVIVAFIGFKCINRPADIIEGQVEGTTVRVSGKLPGRVIDLYVQEGDTVHAGDTLVHIHSSLVDAQMTSARAMEDVARLQDKKVDAGTRVQIINAAASLVNQAEAAVSIAKKTYDRMESLYSQGVISEQKRDEAKAAYDAAVAGRNAAKSQLELAKAGAQSEDKASAGAMVTAAGGQVAQVEALLEDSYLVAPCDGTVDQVFPEVGELVSLGAPIMNILKDERHVVFNVREELLPDFEMGKELTVMLPAMKGKEIKLKVYYVRDMGSYATWRATKSIGSYDSRTFEVRARPADDADKAGLRPGMSAISK